MKMFNYKINRKVFTFAVCILAAGIFFFSCKSSSQTKEKVLPLDYTDQDVIDNEIKTIRELKEKESYFQYQCKSQR